MGLKKLSRVPESLHAVIVCEVAFQETLIKSGSPSKVDVNHTNAYLTVTNFCVFVYVHVCVHVHTYTHSKYMIHAP